MSEVVPKLVGGFGDINYGKQYRQGNRVYDSKYVAMATLAQPVGNMGGYSYLYLTDTHRVIKVGNCSTGTSEGGMVYSPKGVSQTITAGTHGYGCGNICVEVNNDG